MMMSFKKSVSVVAVVVLVLGVTVFPERATATAGGESLNTAIDEMVRESLSKILSGANSASTAFGDIVEPLGNLGQQVVNDYKAMGQTVINAGATLGQQLINSMAASSSHLGDFTESIATIAAAYESSFCSPESFEPAKKKPATFFGPSLNITLTSGSCELDENSLYYEHEKVLNCIQPAVIVTKTPANFTSKHISAPKFESKECKLTKEFGIKDEKVLYVFDGSPIDIASLTNNVMTEIGNALGVVASGTQNLVATQLQNFVSAMSQNPRVRPSDFNFDQQDY